MGPLEDDDVRKRRTDAEREIKELSTQANNLSMELRATELSISSSSQLFSRLRDKVARPKPLNSFEPPNRDPNPMASFGPPLETRLVGMCLSPECGAVANESCNVRCQ